MGRMQGTYHVQIYAGGCIEKKHILCRVLLQGITCAVGKKLQHTNTDHYQQHSATVCVYVMLDTQPEIHLNDGHVLGHHSWWRMEPATAPCHLGKTTPQ